jgi:DnaJ-domain-containing protein 1
MDADLTDARAAIARAIAQTDDPTLREHLESIEEGLEELTNEEDETAASTQNEPPHGDNLESLESTIVDVASETDPPVRSHLETARDEIDEYRRAYTQDW